MLAAANPYMTLVWAFGVGAIAVVVGGTGILLTLGREDRRKALDAIRHPLRTVFSPHEDAEPEETEL